MLVIPACSFLPLFSSTSALRSPVDSPFAEVTVAWGADGGVGYPSGEYGSLEGHPRRHREENRVHHAVVQRDDDGDRGRVLRQADELLVVDDIRSLRRRLPKPVRLRDGEVVGHLDGEVRLDGLVVLQFLA